MIKKRVKVIRYENKQFSKISYSFKEKNGKKS